MPFTRALRFIVATSLFSFLAIPNAVRAIDKTWDNGSANFLWDTSSLNWAGTAWSNATGDGAIFGGAGAGTINAPGVINVNSMNFQSSSNYTFNGAGPFNFVNGTSAQGTGVINVALGATITMNVGITSSDTAIRKIGAGVLELSAPVNVTGTIPITVNNTLNANLLIGDVFGQSPTGNTVRIMNSSVLPSNIKVALGGGGILDIGANNVTIGELIFTNQNQGINFPNHGVIGAGTLRVMGDINVIGQTTLNFGNAIATNLDLGGGTQVIRSSAVSFFSQPSNLILTGTLSNGSLLKTIGQRENGILTQPDGIGLLGNNTYTGSTVINGGTTGFSMASGTNASTSLKVVSATMSLQGANGSYGSANTIEVFAGSTLILDNNAAFGGGSGIPSVPAANNNDRISNSAAITSRDSNLTFRGLNNAASSETYGSLNVTGGHNVITITPGTGTGTATFEAAGNLTLDPRATLQVAGATLSTTGKVKFGGTVPAEVGGIIPRIISASDFVTYDPTDGFKPYASYATSLTAGQNVSLAAASATNTVAVNAIKSTASFVTTINAGQVLTVDTGMMLATATHTLTGGTLDFGATPGVFFGNHTINSAMTGSQGLLHATGTLTLAGDMSGLTGTLSNIGIGTTNLNTNTFTGAIENRRGTLSIGTNTLSGSAPITLGVAANDANLYATPPSLSIVAAGVNAVISRPIIVDNGATNAAGLSLNRQSFVVGLSPLSNTTGSQTVNSDITLNTSLYLQGGGGGGTGATIFGGTISGPGTFILANGRANFTGTLSNAGGMLISSGGFTGIANFQGTASGAYQITVNAGSNSTTGMSYSNQANIGTGTITVNAAGNSLLPTIRVLATSSISNPIILPAVTGMGTFVGGVNVDVAPTFTGTWTGPVTGVGALTKLNTGTLVLTNNGNTYSGNTTVSAGTLRLDGAGSFANSKNIIVGTTAAPVLDVANVTSGANFDASLVPGGSFALAANQHLKGSGTVSGKTAIRNGSFLEPGNSIGTLTFDNDLVIDGTLVVEATSPTSVDLLNLTNTANLSLTGNSILSFAATNTYNGSTPLTLIQLAGGTITGIFGSVLNMPNGYEVQYNLASVVLAPVPEPGTLLLCGLAASAFGWTRWRRRRPRSLDQSIA